MIVVIQLSPSTGIDADNFSIYSLVTSGGTKTFLESGLSRATLIGGYSISNVPNDATIIRLESNTIDCVNGENFIIN